MKFSVAWHPGTDMNKDQDVTWIEIEGEIMSEQGLRNNSDLTPGRKGWTLLQMKYKIIENVKI